MDATLDTTDAGIGIVLEQEQGDGGRVAMTVITYSPKTRNALLHH